MSADGEDEYAEPFTVEIIGHRSQRFVTLHSAMTYAEGIAEPTGVIRCLGLDVIVYDHGNVEQAWGLSAPPD